MMKMKQDNDVTILIGTVYVKNDTTLSWQIIFGANCDEN